MTREGERERERERGREGERERDSNQDGSVEALVVVRGGGRDHRGMHVYCNNMPSNTPRAWFNDL